MTRQELADAILAVLRASTQPLGAKEIFRRLQSGLAAETLTRGDVNSVLYGELSKAGQVVKDVEYRWSVANTPARAIPATVSNRADRAGWLMSRSTTQSQTSATTVQAKGPANSGPTTRKVSSFLTADDLTSVSAAVREEIAATQEE